MSVTPYSSQGSHLQVSISSSFTTIPGARGISGPSTDWDIEDTTALDSPSGYHEFFPTAKKLGPVSFDLIFSYAEATHAYLLASNASVTPVLEAFKLITSAAVPKTLAFSGYVVKFEPDHQSLKVAVVKTQIQPTGLLSIS